jgi:hypothetical protein
VALFCDKDVSGEGKVLVRGATDNKGNKHVVYRFHTTKFPLSMVLMELATRLGDAGLELDLEWVPRASNVEADDLTNNIFEKFDMAKRIDLKWKDLDLPVIEQFMIPAEQFFKQVSEIRLRAMSARGLENKPKTRRKKAKHDSTLDAW